MRPLRAAIAGPMRCATLTGADSLLISGLDGGSNSKTKTFACEPKHTTIDSRGRGFLGSDSMNNLPVNIGSMGVAEKFELLDAISEDLAAQAPAALSEEQATELDRRVAKYEQNPNAVVSWESVKAKSFKQ